MAPLHYSEGILSISRFPGHYRLPKDALWQEKIVKNSPKLPYLKSTDTLMIQIWSFFGFKAEKNFFHALVHGSVPIL